MLAIPLNVLRRHVSDPCTWRKFLDIAGRKRSCPTPVRVADIADRICLGEAIWSLTALPAAHRPDIADLACDFSAHVLPEPTGSHLWLHRALSAARTRLRTERRDRDTAAGMRVDMPRTPSVFRHAYVAAGCYAVKSAEALSMETTISCLYEAAQHAVAAAAHAEAERNWQEQHFIAWANAVREAQQ